MNLTNVIYSKLNGTLRAGMAHLLSGAIPLYIVNEYPKSGGTWAGQMISEAIDVPFPRNRLPVFASSILHGHYMRPTGMRNVLVVWRDGRDVMVSWYFHCLFPNERANAPLVEQVRSEVPFHDYENIHANLPAFIEYAFTRQRQPGFSWADFVRRWYGRENVVYTSYESLRGDTTSELQRLCHELSGQILDEGTARRVVENWSFSRQSGRLPGEESRDSFIRKGVIGDWRNQFSREAREVFNYHAGEALLMLGYELDDSWVAD